MQRTVKDYIAHPTMCYVYFGSMVNILKHILLRVIPTLTYILSDILCGILSHILSDILFGILSGIYSDILSDILSGILSDICCDILSGSLCGILPDMCSGDMVFGPRRAPQHSELAIWCSGSGVPRSMRLAIWCSGLGVPHSIWSWRYGVRVQACPTGGGRGRSCTFVWSQRSANP